MTIEEIRKHVGKRKTFKDVMSDIYSNIGLVFGFICFVFSLGVVFGFISYTVVGIKQMCDKIASCVRRKSCEIMPETQQEKIENF